MIECVTVEMLYSSQQALDAHNREARMIEMRARQQDSVAIEISLSRQTCTVTPTKKMRTLGIWGVTKLVSERRL